MKNEKEWYERHIPLEGEGEVGAGTPVLPRSAREANVSVVNTRIAFGTFVELWRRNRGWDAAKLAKEAGVNPGEILEIEHSPQSAPEPSAVRKLAKVFGLSPKVLLELAGLIEPRTPCLREEAVRFAARSESVAALNPQEREAFEAFVSAIGERAKESA